MKLVRNSDEYVVDTGVKGAGLIELCLVLGLNPDEHALVPENDAEKKEIIQAAIANGFGRGEAQSAALSLVGKAANALSASLNIHMRVYQQLSEAKTLADVRAAVSPAMPLMQRVAAKIENGELMTVQSAQGVSDDDAVIEGLEAMTRTAKTIQSINGVS